jgi:hypothetical protein
MLYRAALAETMLSENAYTWGKANARRRLRAGMDEKASN